MIHWSLAAPFATVLLGVTQLAAQQTWVVDPGGNGSFTTLAAAIAAVAPGDTLLVRGGQHGSVVLDKALTIVGDANAQPVVARLDVGPLTAPGPVSLVRLAVGSLQIATAASLELVAMRSATVRSVAVTMHRCTFGFGAVAQPVLTVQSGDVVLSQCTGQGSASPVFVTRSCTLLGGRPSLEVSGGTVTIADSVLTGASSQPLACPYFAMYGVATAAVSITGGSVAVTRSSLSGGLDIFGARVAAVSGNLMADPSTVIAPPAATTPIFLPATGGQGAPPGSVIVCSAEGGPNTPAVLVAGLGHRPPTALPFGTAWLDPAAVVFLRWGVTDAAGQMGASIPIPASAPRGLPIGVQSVVVSPAGDLVLGVPAILHVL